MKIRINIILFIALFAGFECYSAAADGLISRRVSEPGSSMKYIQYSMRMQNDEIYYTKFFPGEAGRENITYESCKISRDILLEEHNWREEVNPYMFSKHYADISDKVGIDYPTYEELEEAYIHRETQRELESFNITTLYSAQVYTAFSGCLKAIYN